MDSVEELCMVRSIRAMLKLGMIAGYEETDIRVWKNTKKQTELSDLI